MLPIYLREVLAVSSSLNFSVNDAGRNAAHFLPRALTNFDLPMFKVQQGEVLPIFLNVLGGGFP